MVLVDSSVWFLSRSSSELLHLAEGQRLAICPPIVQEILQGAHGEQRMAKAQSIFANSEMLDSPVPIERFEAAGNLYRIARESFTIRSSNDCLIAAIAMHHDVLLLHGDRDFDYIAQLFPLRARSVIPFA